jgi:hypothetical protein
VRRERGVFLPAWSSDHIVLSRAISFAAPIVWAIAQRGFFGSTWPATRVRVFGAIARNQPTIEPCGDAGLTNRRRSRLRRLEGEDLRQFSEPGRHVPLQEDRLVLVQGEEVRLVLEVLPTRDQ